MSALPPALAAVAPRLRCPNCAAPLGPGGTGSRALACTAGHRFDVARHGHLTLTPPGRPPAPGDSAQMVAARAAFLDAGHYAPIIAAVAVAARDAAALRARPQRLAIDLGAGTGHHLAAVLEGSALLHGVALDASRPALRHALRAHPRIAAVVCDIWRRLPVQDAAADLVVNVFAPRNGPEIARVLSPDGALVVVTPTPRHLGEIAGPLGMLTVDPCKPARLRAALAPHLALVDRRPVEFGLALGPEDVRWLVAMGPSAHHHRDGDARRRLDELSGEESVTASVLVEIHRRR